MDNIDNNIDNDIQWMNKGYGVWFKISYFKKKTMF